MTSSQRAKKFFIFYALQLKSATVLRISEKENPFTLEFLGLKEDAAYTESKLEERIITKLQQISHYYENRGTKITIHIVFPI